MMAISDMTTGAVRSLTAAGKAAEASKVQRSEEAVQSSPWRSVRDEYVPEEPQEPSGRYWMEKDEEGQPIIHFDDPERTPDLPERAEDAPDAERPEKEELCVGDTGKVDREIEKLKKKLAELQQRLNGEADEATARDIERQIAQVERELAQKDNETYRKQHSTFTRLE